MSEAKVEEINFNREHNVYLWCISCQKVHLLSEWLVGDVVCSGCGEEGFLNAFDWDCCCSDFRVANQYPDTPLNGGYYPMLSNDPERHATIEIGGSLYWAVRETLEAIMFNN